MIAPIPTAWIKACVARALAEDLGGRGDVTSLAVLPPDATGKFEIRAREAGVLSGSQAAREAFRQIDPDIHVHWRLADGATQRPGAVIARIEGPARDILAAERTALNFLGRMSGIATLTRRYVEAVAGTDAAVAHTRKTTPGLRALELQAVRAGGGAMHRYGLDDAILIKDNHVAVAGGVGEAVRRARDFAGHMTRISVEIDRLDQLSEAVGAGAECVLLDNFSVEDLAAAVERAPAPVTLEASGGITLENVRAVAETGVDVISIGALTHSAPNLDFGMDAVWGP